MAAMPDWELACSRCAAVPPRDFAGFRCPVCSGALDVRCEPDFPRAARTGRSLWHYEGAIPVSPESAVSLGEGMTPVVESELDGDPVFLKLEYRSPTGSYKDRGATVLVSRLREMGIREILEDSSGNAGCALAAYAAAAGIACRVLIPASAPAAKALQIAAYGALLERIPSSRDGVAREAVRRAAETFYASHNWQPFFLQGTKTFAYEIADQIEPLPESILFPLGNGGLLLGSFKGFTEMKRMGWIREIPRLIGVQVATHAPVHAALTGERPNEIAATTIAGGIAIRDPIRLHAIVDAIRATRGTVVLVEDDEILRAQRDLARKGFLVEPTSAAALAGYRAWRRTEPRGRVLLPLTGSGLKDLDSLAVP